MRTLLITGLLVLGACAAEDAGDTRPWVTESVEVEMVATPDTTIAVETTVAPVETAPAPYEDPSLSEAFCNDLRAGLTPMNIWQGVRDEYDPEEFADKAYGMAAISCPEQLTDNEGLRVFLTNWNINPDA